jgi:hypothetical protein
MKAGAGQHGRDSRGPHRGAQHLQAPHDVRNDVREPVDGLGRPDERGRSVLIEPDHPVGDRGLGHEEPLGRLRCRPAASGAEFEDGEALHRWIVRAVTRRDALHASVLDAQFLAEQGQFVLQADGGGDAVGGRAQGDPGQGEGVEDRGASSPRPAAGQSEPETAVARHDRTLLGASIVDHAVE